MFSASYSNWAEIGIFRLKHQNILALLMMRRVLEILYLAK